MVQKINVVLEDDLEGGPADETVRFGLGSVTYEIDLSEKNAAALKAALDPYIDNARKVHGRVGRPRAAASPQRNRETALIREWAKENGYKVNDRGRINAHIIEAYRAAQG